MKRDVSPMVEFALKKFFGEAAVTAFGNEDISNYSQAELDNYEHRAKPFRDLKNVIDTAEREGKERGIRKGIRKVAKALKDNGVAFDLISETMELPIEEIEQL